MPLFRPRELHQFLQTLGITPSKGLSQNFLVDGNILDKILQVSEVEAGDVVLEIGPGPGALSEKLLDAGASLIAVEKDKRLAEALWRLSEERLQVYAEDILAFPVEEVVGKKLENKNKNENESKAKLIANLPYHIATRIITQLVPLHTIFSKLVVMVQDEVARRMTASPGSKAYGSLSVLLQYYSEPKYAFQVRKNSFFPPPKVNSAVVVLTPRPPPSVSSLEGFFALTRTAFGTRRKMLRSALKGLYASDRVERELVALGLNPQARAEELSLSHFIALFERLGDARRS